MKLLSIKITGFRNLDNTKLDFTNRLTALIAFNNYGKSNVLEAIYFGFCVIQRRKADRLEFLKTFNFYPKTSKNKDFSFQIEFEEQTDDQVYHIKYGYTFSWANEQFDERDFSIQKETFKLKQVGKSSKFRELIRRTGSKCEVVFSEKGRLKPMQFDVDDFALEQVLRSPNFYSLFIGKIYNFRFKIIGLKKLRNESVAKTLLSWKRFAPSQFDLLENTFKTLIPEIEFLKLEILSEERYTMLVKEKHHREAIPLKYLSSGTKKILDTLIYLIGKTPYPIMLAIEEPENSIHPRLLQRLLIIMDELAGDSNILLSSHSPNLIRYLPLDSMYFGTPTSKGLATFKKIKKTKQNSVMRSAQELNMHLGDYVFELLDEEEFCEEMM